MKSNNRFQLSEKRPSEYPIKSNDDAMCVDIAISLEEPDMRFILARRSQLGMQPIYDAYAVVKDYVRSGKCRDKRCLFNFLLTQKLKEKNTPNNLDQQC